MERKTYTENDYINKCNQINLKYIGNHKEKKKGTIIEYICNKHQNIGIQNTDWSHLKNYKGCPYCSGRYRTTEEFKKMIFYNNVEVISEYEGFEKPIQCRCLDCGYIWKTLPKVISSNRSGCPVCGKKKAILGETKTESQFKQELASINPNIEVLGDYINTHTKILCRCKIDGNKWYAYPANLLNKSAGCPMCTTSLGEYKLLLTLQKMNINYVHQYTIPDLKRVNRLRFDAFCKDKNVAFEYNGEQHYRPVDFANKGEKWANEQFALVQERDAIKKAYCVKNNICLIIIPYWEKDNMEQYISNKMKEKNIA